jgi:hypothetical protein
VEYPYYDMPMIVSFNLGLPVLYNGITASGREPKEPLDGSVKLRQVIPYEKKRADLIVHEGDNSN